MPSLDRAVTLTLRDVPPDANNLGKVTYQAERWARVNTGRLQVERRGALDGIVIGETTVVGDIVVTLPYDERILTAFYAGEGKRGRISPTVRLTVADFPSREYGATSIVEGGGRGRGRGGRRRRSLTLTMERVP